MPAVRKAGGTKKMAGWKPALRNGQHLERFDAAIINHFQVYEQFLGKVIRLTPAHKAKVDDKPEVKKAGGVYYTPTYVVDYIVQHTVGKLLDSATLKQASKLRILDPACGSGSFLLGAYEYLLKWHRDRYIESGPAKHRKELYKGEAGAWRLSTAEKKRILLNNIYGVDIDSQAVEVTKLSLLLKVLEGESEQTLEEQFRLFHERALPDLGQNIRCGNSLVASDSYVGQQLDLIDEERQYRINAFDWVAEFPKILRDGGFSAIIGNPPYSYRNATEETLRPYYLAQYRSAEGNYELYKFFVEKSLSLARPGGFVGLIVSASFLVQPSFEKLRRLILGSAIQRLAPLGPKVFANATVDTAILIARKTEPNNNHQVIIQAPARSIDLAKTETYTATQSRFTQNAGAVFDYRLSDTGAALVRRLLRTYPPIEEGFEFGVGINTGYIRDELVSATKEDKRFHPMVPGDGISRYGPIQTDGWIMYDKDFVRSKGDRGRTLPAEHLLSSDKILVVRTRNLVLPRRIIATIDRSGSYNLNRLSNIVARPSYSLLGLLGILNSTLFNWLYATRFFDYEIKPFYLRMSPMAAVNNKELIEYVERILSLRAQLEKMRLPQERTVCEREIASTDRKINQIVYELYGMSKAEIALVHQSPFGAASIFDS